MAGLILAAIFFHRSDAVLKITAWILFGLLTLGLLVSAVLAALLSQLPPELLLPAGDEAFTSLTQADVMVGIEGFWWAMLARVGLWVIATPGTVLGLAVPLSVLLGLLASRHRWLERAGSRVRLGIVALWGIAVGVLGGLPSALHYLDLLPFGPSIDYMLVMLSQLTGVFGGLGYAALFAILAQRLAVPLRGASSAIAAVGKRSLSCYLLQSALFAPVLSAWGFGLGSRIGTTAAFAFAIGVWAVSVVFAVLLERRGARGPAEVLLRRLTYGRLEQSQPALPR